tara:strand:- start:59 stop:457 length:399 start_codon:yes stop_codon:yes gene_type:complete
MVYFRRLIIYSSACLLFFASIAFAEEGCDSPVNMMIISKVTDQKKYDAYRQSVGELNLIGKLGGKLVAVGAGSDVTPELLEGEWPSNLFNYIIRWPCRNAAHKFWYSDGYQNISKPLRAGAGDFTIALFPAD